MSPDQHHELRASLQVAPLTILKAKGGQSCADGSPDPVHAPSSSSPTPSQNPDGQHSRPARDAQMTPPTTPNSSQESLVMAPTPPPMFHNFLRAIYPFHPSHAMVDSTVTLALNEGEVVMVHSIHTNGWADGTLLASGARGWLPTNYCDAYDPDEMRNLLKALLNFWDLMRSPAVNDSELFCNQEFMKGVIAGVRYLLERTHCLTRESPVIQRHEGLRRQRKGILSELSLVVKTAKRIQEIQGEAGVEDQVNNMVDEMILRAFKIITKGVRFLDVLEDDRRIRAPAAVTVMATVLEEASVPPTPPAEATTFDGAETPHAGTRAGGGGGGGEDGRRDHHQATMGNAAAAQGSWSQTGMQGPPPASSGRHVSTTSSSAANNARRLSRGNALHVHRRSSSISHRMSLVGPSPVSQPQNLVSERLNSCHDTFLSHLGSFIGRLQLQSQSRPHLALAVRQSAASGIQLLTVVDIVCAYCGDPVHMDPVDQARSLMYDRIRDLVRTARDILGGNGQNGAHALAQAANAYAYAQATHDLDEDIIVPHDNSRLLWTATACVKATGECVAKTKWLIERIGDFEFEFENGQGSLGIDLDLPPAAVAQDEDEDEARGRGEEDEARSSEWVLSGRARSASIAESNGSETPSTTNSSASTTRPTTAFAVDKPLPRVPEVTTPVESSAPRDSGSKFTPISSFRPTLPPLPRISTSLRMPSDDYSPIDMSTSHESDFGGSFRSEKGMTALSAGSATTYLSRDSESSVVSQTSTRATTPDNTTSHAATTSRPSMSDLRSAAAGNSSSSSSHAANDDVDDLESRLLEKTYAHELMFNKEGQVTGGSLEALVERLTTHESTPDAVFVSTFYLTFRLFCTPWKLAETLIDRFDYVGEASHIASPVRLRTYNVFKGWLESHWRAETDREALELIRPFAQTELMAVLPNAGRRLLALADKVSSTDVTLLPRLLSSMGKTNTAVAQNIPADSPLPAPVITRSQTNALANWKASRGPCPTVLDLDPLEMARQFTIRAMTIFCAIEPHELLSQSSKFSKRGHTSAPNAKALSAFSTGVTNLVVDTILQYDEAKKRASVTKQWIKVAGACRALHNYETLMAIISALTNSSVKRLKLTWDTVSARRKETLRGLAETVNPDRNYKVLRGLLHDHVPPCLPFLGTFLTDLMFIDAGNPRTRTMSDSGLEVVNFDKHAKTAKTIGEIQRFQIPFRLAEVPDLQDWIRHHIARVDEKDRQAGKDAHTMHWRKSHLLEPRAGGGGPAGAGGGLGGGGGSMSAAAAVLHKMPSPDDASGRQRSDDEVGAAATVTTTAAMAALRPTTTTTVESDPTASAAHNGSHGMFGWMRSNTTTSQASSSQGVQVPP